MKNIPRVEDYKKTLKESTLAEMTLDKALYTLEMMELFGQDSRPSFRVALKELIQEYRDNMVDLIILEDK